VNQILLLTRDSAMINVRNKLISA